MAEYWMTIQKSLYLYTQKTPTMRNIFLVIGIFFFSHLSAQVVRNELYTPIEYKRAYEKGTRMKDGSVSPKYKQNHSDYKIKAAIDPKKRLIKGSATIIYYNESNDSLANLVIHTYADLTKKNALHYHFDPDPKQKLGDETKGMVIEKLSINGQSLDMTEASGVYTWGTFKYIWLFNNYIAPGSKTTIEVSWHFTLPLNNFDRTGAIDPTSMFVGYWYPEIAVYDDVNGWDYNSYNGTAEFYHDNSNYDIELEVPTNYVVWASVEPTNAKEIYPDFIQQNLEKAKTSTTPIPVVSADDLKKVKMKSGVWKYTAKEFPDFCFALSDHYVWDAGMYSDQFGTYFLHSAYNPKNKEFKEVLKTEQGSIKKFHTQFPKYEFPFHYFTIFQGNNGGGMEFPGMANDQAISGELAERYYGKTMNDYDAQFGLSLHEMCHMYFPFLMGINEKLYAWMDEGWASFSEFFIDGESDSKFAREDYGNLNVTPIMTPTNSQPENSGTNSYDMGSFSYYSLYYLLGEDLFFKCLHSYMDQWKRKHPTPYDFFYCFNTAAKQDLNWFWQNWYFDWGYPDVGINDFKNRKLELENYGRKAIAFTIHITYADDTQYKETISPVVWKSSDKYVYPVLDTREVKLIEITTKTGTDAVIENNYWPKN
jgi:hypothetical protein